MFKNLYFKPKEYVIGFLLEGIVLFIYMFTLTKLSNVLNLLNFYNNFYYALLFWGVFILIF